MQLLFRFWRRVCALFSRPAPSMVEFRPDREFVVRLAWSSGLVVKLPENASAEYIEGVRDALIAEAAKRAGAVS